MPRFLPRKGRTSIFRGSAGSRVDPNETSLSPRVARNNRRFWNRPLTGNEASQRLNSRHSAIRDEMAYACTLMLRAEREMVGAVHCCRLETPSPDRHCGRGYALCFVHADEKYGPCSRSNIAAIV